MTNSHHDLAHEFPEFKETIHTLKTTDNHFRKIFDHYHEINNKIHGAEQRTQLMSEVEEENLRKERGLLKDQLYAMLLKAKA